MRMTRKLTPVLLLLMLVTSCGHRADQIPIGSDGYGRGTLDNGITVLANHDETTSLTAARILIGGGVLTETARNNGITNLMIRMLTKGNETMTASEITERLEFLGANVSADCYRDYSAISISCMTEYFDEVLGVISASLTSPTFPADELEKLKLEVEGNIKSSNDNQSTASSKLFWNTAYGDQAYGLPTLGLEETVKGISVEDIRGHFEKYVGGSNILFSISTDLTSEEISSIARNRLGGIRPEAESVAKPISGLQDDKDGFIDFDRNQSFIYMGAVFDHLQPDDLACVALLHEIMGSGVGSRLWYLRQKEKLAYAVYSQWLTGKYTTVFRAAIGTDTSKVQTALASLDREWTLLANEGITEAELTDAKINLKNNLIYRIDRKSGRADNMAYYEYIGCDYRFILDLIEMADRITLADVNGFIKENLSADQMYTSVVGKL